MFEQIAVVVGITFLAMISPGPDMVIVTKNTLLAGRMPGLWTSLGILGGNAIHMIYCALGVGWIISQSIVAFSILKYAGAAYLIYLGIMSLRAEEKPLDLVTTGQVTADKGWFWQGFVNNVLNPKATLFYLGVFTVVITAETSVATTLLLVVCMKLVSGSFWVLFVYTLDRPFIRTVLERSQRYVNRVFGILLIGLGVRVAILEG
ncbi:MAG: LysE family translocator [Chloroflexota bacterium]